MKRKHKLTEAEEFERDDARLVRRLDREAERFNARWDRIEALAAPRIGELCREGRTVYYACAKPGLYRESEDRQGIVNYLHRNGYLK